MYMYFVLTKVFYMLGMTSILLTSMNVGLMYCQQILQKSPGLLPIISSTSSQNLGKQN